jgi:LPXTG-site transpeptidase (sortase) family protein
VGQLFHLQLPSLSDLLASSGSDAPVAPTRISIPKVDVQARIVAVGKADDGSIAVPTQDPVRYAGWYKLGVGPGDAGTAVIVGHVDTKSKAAVFARLPELAKGDRIEVTRRDGHVVAFSVDSVERTPKTAFPANTIFAASAKPRLVLVTCGGPWIGGAIGYADNVIVYASLAS